MQAYINLGKKSQRSQSGMTQITQPPRIPRPLRKEIPRVEGSRNKKKKIEGKDKGNNNLKVLKSKERKSMTKSRICTEKMPSIKK